MSGTLLAIPVMLSNIDRSIDVHIKYYISDETGRKFFTTGEPEGSSVPGITDYLPHAFRFFRRETAERFEEIMRPELRAQLGHIAALTSTTYNNIKLELIK